MYNKELANALSNYLLSYLDVSSTNGVPLKHKALEEFIEEFLNNRLTDSHE